MKGRNYISNLRHMKAPKSGWATGNNGDLTCLHFLPDGATGPRVRASGEEWTSLQWTGQG